MVAAAGLGLALAGPARANGAVSCQAIDATGVISGMLPKSSCPSVAAGQKFEIDFSDIFANTPAAFPLNKFYSLQIANLNNGASNTLNFSDVSFLVSGAIGGTTFTDQAITIWTSSSLEPTPVFPFAQGLGGYTTSGNTGMFGMSNVASKASFSLTGPVSPTQLGSAALINTVPVNLAAAGITSFTGAKIVGTFLGSDNSVATFSAGLALFDEPVGAPDVIYGNAYNVPVPGPLPIIGVGAAFGWSRRLRRRVAARTAR